jgi:hypothetical protein
MPVTKDDIAQAHYRFLFAEGYQPRIDATGDVLFRVEGSTYFIPIDPNDAQYYAIFLPNFFRIDAATSLQDVLRAAHEVTATTKVVKVYVMQDMVVASIELFCDSPEDFHKVFQRAVQAIQSGVRAFFDKLRPVH